MLNPLVHSSFAAKFKFLSKVKQEMGQTDTRLTKSEYRDLINHIVEEIPGEGAFDFFLDFIETCVEVS